MTNSNPNATPNPTALQPKPDSQIDYILLDCSDSMDNKWWESLASVDAYVKTVRSLAVDSQVIFQMFYASNPDHIQRNLPISEWTDFDSSTPGPEGMTPLYDAINYMGRRLRELDPPRASIVIVTDGEDNASNFTTISQATAILDWCRAKGWQVTFIGADFANRRMVRLLGGQDSSSLGVQKRLLTDAAKSLAEKRARYGTTGADIHFSDAEQTQFGGYLTKQ